MSSSVLHANKIDKVNFGFRATIEKRIPSFLSLMKKAYQFANTVSSYGTLQTKLIIKPVLLVCDLVILFQRFIYPQKTIIKGLNEETEQALRKGLENLFARALTFDEAAHFSGNKAYVLLQKKLIDSILCNTLGKIPEKLLNKLTPEQASSLFQGDLRTSFESVLRAQTQAISPLCIESLLEWALPSVLEKLPFSAQELLTDLSLHPPDKEAKILFFLQKEKTDLYSFQMYTSEKTSFLQTIDGQQERGHVYEFTNLTLTKINSLKPLMLRIQGCDPNQLPMTFEEVKILIATHFGQEPQVKVSAQTTNFSLGQRDTHKLALLQQFLSQHLFAGEYEKTDELLFTFSLSELMLTVSQKGGKISSQKCAILLRQVSTLRFAFNKLTSSLAKYNFSCILDELEQRLTLSMSQALRSEKLQAQKKSSLPVIPTALWPIFDWLFSTYGTDEIFLQKVNEGLERSLGKSYTQLLEAAKEEYLLEHKVPKKITLSREYAWYEKTFAIILCFSVHLVLAKVLSLAIPVLYSAVGVISCYLNNTALNLGTAAYLSSYIDQLIPADYKAMFDKAKKEVLYLFIPYAMELFYRYFVIDSFKKTMDDLAQYVNACTFRCPEVGTDIEGFVRDHLAPEQESREIPSEAAKVVARLQKAKSCFEEQILNLAQSDSPILQNELFLNMQSSMRLMDKGLSKKISQYLESQEEETFLPLWQQIFEEYPTLFSSFPVEQKQQLKKVLDQFTNRKILKEGEGFTIVGDKKELLFETNYQLFKPSILNELVTHSSFSTLINPFLAQGNRAKNYLDKLLKGRLFQVSAQATQKPLQAIASISSARVVSKTLPAITTELLGGFSLRETIEHLNALSIQERRHFFAQRGKTLTTAHSLIDQLFLPNECQTVGSTRVPNIWLECQQRPHPKVFHQITKEIQDITKAFPEWDPSSSLEDYFLYLDSVKGLAAMLIRRGCDIQSLAILPGCSTYVAVLLSSLSDSLVKALEKMNLLEKGIIHCRFAKMREADITRLATSTETLIFLLITLESQNLEKLYCTAIPNAPIRPKLLPNGQRSTALLISSLLLSVMEYVINKDHHLGLAQSLFIISLRQEALSELSSSLKMQRTELSLYFIKNAASYRNWFWNIQDDEKLKNYFFNHLQTDDDALDSESLDLFYIKSIRDSQDKLKEEDKKFLETGGRLLRENISRLAQTFRIAKTSSIFLIFPIESSLQGLFTDNPEILFAEPYYNSLPRQLSLIIDFPLSLIINSPRFRAFSKTVFVPNDSSKLWTLEGFHALEEGFVENKHRNMQSSILEALALSPYPLARFLSLTERHPIIIKENSVLEGNSFINKIFSDLENAQECLKTLGSAREILEIVDRLLSKEINPPSTFVALAEWIYATCFLYHDSAIVDFKNRIGRFKQEVYSIAAWYTIHPEDLPESQRDLALVDMLLAMPSYARSNTLLERRTFERFFPYLIKKMSSSPDFLKQFLERHLLFESAELFDVDMSLFPQIYLTRRSNGEQSSFNLETRFYIPLLKSPIISNSIVKKVESATLLKGLTAEVHSHDLLYFPSCDLFASLIGPIYREINGQKWQYQKINRSGSSYHLLTYQEGDRVQAKVFDASLTKEIYTVELTGFDINTLMLLSYRPFLFQRLENPDYPPILSSFALGCELQEYTPIDESYLPKETIIKVLVKNREKAVFAKAQNMKQLRCLTASGMPVSPNQNVPSARALGPYIVLSQDNCEYILYEPLPIESLLIYRTVQSQHSFLAFNPMTVLTLCPDLKASMRSKGSTLPSFSLLLLDKNRQVAPTSYEDLQSCLAISLHDDPIAFSHYAELFCQKVALEGALKKNLDAILCLFLAHLLKGQPLMTEPLLKMAIALAHSESVQGKNSDFIKNSLLTVLGTILYKDYVNFNACSYTKITAAEEALWLGFIFNQVIIIGKKSTESEKLQYILQGAYTAFLHCLLDSTFRERVLFIEREYPNPDSSSLSTLMHSAFSKYFSFADVSSIYIPLVSESAPLWGWTWNILQRSLYRGATALASKQLEKLIDFSVLPESYISTPKEELTLTLSSMTPKLIHQNFVSYAQLLVDSVSSFEQQTLHKVLEQVVVPKKKEFAPLYILKQLFLQRADYSSDQDSFTLRGFYTSKMKETFPEAGVLDRLKESKLWETNYAYAKEQMTSSRLVNYLVKTSLGYFKPNILTAAQISGVRAVGGAAMETFLFTSARRCRRENEGHYDFMSFLVSESRFLHNQFTTFFERYFERTPSFLNIAITTRKDPYFETRITKPLKAYQAIEQNKITYVAKEGFSKNEMKKDLTVFERLVTEQLHELEKLLTKIARRGEAYIKLEELINYVIEPDYKSALMERLNLGGSLVDLIVLRLVHFMLVRSYAIKFSKMQKALTEGARIETIAEMLGEPKYYLESLWEKDSTNLSIKQQRFVLGCLAIEIKMGIELKKLQTHQLWRALSNDTGKDIVIEMIPGSGKTDFGMVLNAFFSWEKGCVPIVVFTEELVESMKLNFATRFKQMTGRDAFSLKVSRDANAITLRTIFLRFKKAADEGDVIITTKEDLQTLQLLFIEIHQILYDKNSSAVMQAYAKEVWPFLQKINGFILESGCLQGDECQVLINPSVVEKFPIGEKNVPARDQIMGEGDVLHELLKYLNGRSVDVLTKAEYETSIRSHLAAAIARREGLDIREYLASQTSEKPLFLYGHPQEAYLAMCRGTINVLIPFALEEGMKADVTYGPSETTFNRYAIPYNGNKVPDESSIFDHSEVTLILSYFYYLKKGLSLRDYKKLLYKFKQISTKESEEEACPIEMTMPYEFLNHFFGTRTPTYEQMRDHPESILNYVALCIAPTIQSYNSSCESTSADFISMVKHPAIFYSGTIYNNSVYGEMVLCDSPATTGETLHTIRHAMESRGGIIIELPVKETKEASYLDFLRRALSDPNCRMIIDCATLLAGVNNEDVARTLMQMAIETKRAIRGVQFFDKKGVLRVVVGERGEALLASDIPLKEEERISYLGDRFFGVNISQAEGSSAAISIGSHNLATFEQAAWRMRGLLDKKQYINLYIEQRAAAEMRFAGHSISFEGILAYLVDYEYKELLPLNFQASVQRLQGCVRSVVMEKMIKSSPSQSLALFKDFKKFFMQDNQSSLITRYGETVHEVAPSILLDNLTRKLIVKVTSSRLTAEEKTYLINRLQSEPRQAYPSSIKTSSDNGLSPSLLRETARVVAREETKTQEQQKEVQKVVLVSSKENLLPYLPTIFTPWPDDLSLDNLAWLYLTGSTPDPASNKLQGMPCATIADLFGSTSNSAWKAFGTLFGENMLVTNNVIRFHGKKVGESFFSWLGLTTDSLAYQRWKKPVAHVLLIYDTETHTSQYVGLSEVDGKILAELLHTKINTGKWEFALCNPYLGIVEKNSSLHGHIDEYIKTSSFTEAMVLWQIFNFDDYFTPKAGRTVKHLLKHFGQGRSDKENLSVIEEVSAIRHLDVPSNPVYAIARRVFAKNLSVEFVPFYK